MLSPRRRGGNRVDLAGIKVKQASAALKIQQCPFAYLVPELGAQRHLARQASLPGGSRQRSLTRGRGDAVVLRKQGFVHPFSDYASFLLENIKLVLKSLGSDASPLLFLFHQLGWRRRRLTRLGTLILQRLTLDQAVQLLVLNAPNLRLDKSNLVLQGVELLVRLDAVRLFAIFDQFLLLILAIAFQSSAAGFFRWNGFVCLLHCQLLLL